MQDLNGKVAFVTGGAGGIGLAMAKAFGREGMAVMIADIERDALTAAVEELRAGQVRAEGVLVDVASSDSLRAAALETRRVRQGACGLQQCRRRGRRTAGNRAGQ